MSGDQDTRLVSATLCVQGEGAAPWGREQHQHADQSLYRVLFCFYLFF